MNKKLNVVNIILALILVFILLYTIHTQIKEYYLQDDPKLKELLKTVEPLFTSDNYYSGYLKDLNRKNILSNISLYKGDKSYTINKEKVFLCLKNENGEYYNKNMLIYVFLHEISHVICDEVGHTQKFHDIFEQILDEATKKGIYNPSIPIISDYCNYN